jgi:putative zinc finger protein
MCDFSGKLIAWMDGELRESDAADVERHVSACGDCRELLAAYQQASGAFEAFCEATFAAGTRRAGVPRRALVACVAAAAAIAVLLLWPLERVAESPARLAPAARTRHAAEEGADGRTVEAPAAISARAQAALPAARTGNNANKARRTYASQASPKQRPGSKGQITPTSEPSPRQSADAFPAGPPIQIDISADAMFPPGVLPQGMVFSADLTISADGSPERLRLRPQLAGFERRTDQP